MLDCKIAYEDVIEVTYMIKDNPCSFAKKLLLDYKYNGV